MSEQQQSAAGLAAAVLSDDTQARTATDRTVVPDDLLLGVGDEPMTFKDALKAGGTTMVVFMFLLNVIDDLPRAVRVVAPDIQKTFGISDTTLTAMLSFGGVALVLGAVPMGRLADRIKRVTIIPIASLFWAVTTALTGLVANPFQMFWTNAATGIGQAGCKASSASFCVWNGMPPLRASKS